MHSRPVVPNARSVSSHRGDARHQLVINNHYKMRSLLRSAAGMACRSSRVGYNSSRAQAGSLAAQRAPTACMGAQTDALARSECRFGLQQTQSPRHQCHSCHPALAQSW
jgi:hypothetical protein